jgi:hypothetical protein
MGSARKSCTDRSTNSSHESTYTIAAVAGEEGAAPVMDKDVGCEFGSAVDFRSDGCG